MKNIIESLPEVVVKVLAMLLWPLVVLAACLAAIVLVFAAILGFFAIPFTDMKKEIFETEQ
jgi:hypothetical protein